MDMVKLKIELKDIGAKRVVFVPGNITLESLHNVIQALFGWEGCHLWMFSNNKGQNIWQPSFDGTGLYDHLDPYSFSVEDLLPKVGDHAEYEYDFGDSWRHRITRMTDPRPNVNYECVKAEGPDGEEDTRFSPGDDDEPSDDQIPTLDEINRRLPALDELEKIDVNPRLDEKSNGGRGPCLMDILNSKSESDLQCAAMGLPGIDDSSQEGLRKSLRDFYSSDAARKSIALSLVISITNPYFEAFCEAASKGSALMKNMPLDDVSVFKTSPITQVQRSGTRDIRLFVASEIRDMWAEMSERWKLAHKDWDTAHALVDAAVRLYGGVTVGDFAKMLNRFYDMGDCPLELIEGVMGLRASCWDSNHFVEKGIIYASRFDSLSDYKEFARKRDVYPRWEPNDFEELYDYCKEMFFEKTPQREELVDFCIKTFRDSPDTAEGVVNQIQYELVDGASAEYISDEFSVDFPNPDMCKRKVAEIKELVQNVRDNMRLAEYNGNTYCSLTKTLSNTRSVPKVGRNDPCPCGSGKKFKKCCGRE